MTAKEFIQLKKEQDKNLANVMDSAAWEEVIYLLDEYLLEKKRWHFCPKCGVPWEHDSEAFGCWKCGYIR